MFTTRSILKPGDKGIDVAVLQFQLRQLHYKLGVSLSIPDVHSVFDRSTLEAVMEFQRLVGIFPCPLINIDTRTALSRMLSEKGIAPPNIVNHNITLIPQPTKVDCWAASTAMMTNSTVPLVLSKVPNDIRTHHPDNSIWGDIFDGLLSRRSGGLDMGVKSGKGIDSRFASTFNLQQYGPQSWSAHGFRKALRESPLMLAQLHGEDFNSTRGGHAVVISAMVGDNNDSSGMETYIQKLDPWPVGIGEIVWEAYHELLSKKPLATYSIFARK